VVDGEYRKFATRTILCAVSLQEASHIVAEFAAELAAQHSARLILQHVIRPQERHEVLAGRTIDQIEADLLALVPAELRERLPCRPSWCPATRPRNCSTRAGRNWRI
jgi:nucleotide-binding universal stress UspA family protein